MQRIEPAARLIDSFTDVIRRELRFEFLLVLKRIVPLRHGHRTRVKPDIDEIGYTRHALRAAAFGAIPMDLIDIRAMKIEFAQVTASLFRKFLDGTNALAMFAGYTFPDGKRCSPITLAAQSPVYVVG